MNIYTFYIQVQDSYKEIPKFKLYLTFENTICNLIALYYC
jgi:hypothetical protein